MKKRVLAAGMALGMVLGLNGQALAAGEDRLVGVKEYVDGALDVEYTFTYEDGGALPRLGRKNVLGDHSYVMFEGTDREYVRDGMPSLDWTWAYDGAGRMTEHTETYPSGSTYIDRWVYDGDGPLVRRERESPEGAGLPLLTTVTCAYDEAGRLRAETWDDDGAADMVSEYMYAKDGSLTAQNNFSLTGSEPLDDDGRPIHSKGAVSQTAYDYGQDGRVCRELSVVDGMLWSETILTYADDPVFSVQYGQEHNYMNDEDSACCNFILRDAADKNVLSFSLPGTPELTYDGEGRLVKAETEERSMEFVYEAR